MTSTVGPYAFLALPPPPTNSNPTRSSSTRRHRSSTFTAGIIKWAVNVQPGSPTSPHRSLRRLSIKSSHGSPKSLLHLIDTQNTPLSPSIVNFKPSGDSLLAQGYTSVFVHLTEAPVTPLPVKSHPLATIQSKDPSSQKLKGKGLKHFRSLSLLRSPFGRSQVSSVAPPVPPAPKSPHSRYPVSPNTKRKRHQGQLPPSLAQELLLMQFVDGGKIDEHAARAMAAQAKAAGNQGVAAPHRDDEGGIWWDKEEKEEYDRLLTDPATPKWVQFDASAQDGDALMVLELADEARRGSFSTVGSNCTAELLNRHPLQPDEPRRVYFRTQTMEGFIPSPTVNMPSVSANAETIRPKGKSRRRPAPLNLTPPAMPLPPTPQPSTWAPSSRPRMELNPFEDSFTPVVRRQQAIATAKALNGKTSMAKLHIRGLFKKH